MKSIIPLLVNDRYGYLVMLLLFAVSMQKAGANAIYHVEIALSQAHRKNILSIIPCGVFLGLDTGWTRSCGVQAKRGKTDELDQLIRF